MKRLCVVATIFLLGIGTLSAQILDRPVAIVKLTETVNIGQRELKQQASLLSQQLGRDLTAANRKELLDAKIAEVLIDQAAKRKNIRVTQEEVDRAIAQQRQSLAPGATADQFKQMVEQQSGMTWDRFTEQIKQRLIQEKYVMQSKKDVFDGVKQPTDQEVQSFYDENATQFTNPAMVRFQHIFVDTRNASSDEKAQKRQFAEELYQEIKSGSKTFQEVADAAVDNPKYSAGDFGFLARQDQRSQSLLGKEFIDNVFSIDKGSLSRGVLESKVGFHIVKVTDKRAARILGLNDPVLPGQSVTVRDQIRNYLVSNSQQKAFQKALGEVVKELKSEAEIKIFDENLNW